MLIQWKGLCWRFWEEIIHPYPQLTQMIWRVLSLKCLLKSHINGQVCAKSSRNPSFQIEFRNFWRWLLPEMSFPILLWQTIWTLRILALNLQSRRRKRVTVEPKEAVQQLLMRRRVKHKKFIVMVLMSSLLSRKLPYQKTLHEKRNVSRLSRTIMEDHQIIMPRSRQQQTTTLTQFLMLTRPKRMKMVTYSKLMRPEIRPGANISRVAGLDSNTEVSHLFRRLSFSQMAPW